MAPRKNRRNSSLGLPLRHDRFGEDSLRCPGALEETATWVLKRVQEASSPQSATVLRDLAKVPSACALLLTTSYELRSLVYRDFVRARASLSSAKAYSESIPADILLALSQFLGSLNPPPDVDAELYGEQCASGTAVHQLLKDIASTAASEGPAGDASVGAPHRQSSKQKKKYVKWQSNSHDDDSDPLETGQETSPTSERYTAAVEAELLETQWSSLRYFLRELLPMPSVSRQIRAVVLRIIDAPEDHIVSRGAVMSIAETPLPVVSSSTYDTEAPTTDLYPQIQPPKAKLVFDSPEGWGSWRIYLAGNAIKDLRDFHRSDQKTFGIVQKKIKQLSCGFFSSSNQKPLVGGSDEVNIFEAKLTGDLRLVYRIDLETDVQAQLDRQVILIYGIYTHAKLDQRLWKQVSHCLPRKNADYRRRCIYRAQPIMHGNNINNITLPGEWPHQEVRIAPVTEVNSFSEEEFLQLHKIISLERFVHLSNALLRNIMADIDAMHPFAVSSTENQIINHDGSCFVIGRSGTGKTTTMVFKMLGIELSDRQSQQQGVTPKLRQIFLTQSHVLASRVSNYYRQLVQAIDPTSSIVSLHSTDEDEGLLGLEENNDERADLPAKFSNLEDKHFPLFATFDQIRRMLEADLGISFSRQEVLRRRTVAAGSTSSPQDAEHHGMENMYLDGGLLDSPRKSFVTFDVFLAEFWRHFDQRLVKGLDPARVFSEIMGVIRGHEDTIGTEAGYLDRQSYQSLSQRAHASFALDRERLYTIFEKYLQRKYEAVKHDGPDRTHAILRGFRTMIPGTVDFIYVDEVQDLLTIDTKLLRELCQNPRGLFWGGDTAQTISVGSSFRFEDLKALMWREEEAHPHVKEKLRPAIHPANFELLVNYRSHGGIVDCAASLIELLAALFPYSIDKLQRESALVGGPKPCVFLSDVVHFEEFLGVSGGDKLDFGARQVIITRDDAARIRLRETLGDSGLIFTLLESKGLEFDDVLLYDFFTTSPAKPAQWRIVSADTKQASDKFRIIESELKRLYVALTRARHHCWIWESEPHIDPPMLAYWSSHGLVKLHRPGEAIPSLATKSTPEEWFTTGETLFSRRLYAQAAACFTKAGRSLDSAVAQAYDLQQQASLIQSSPRKREMFARAALAFRSCAIDATHRLNYSQGLYEKAGYCFHEAADLLSAAESYVTANKMTTVTKAALIYRKLGKFEEAVALAKPPAAVSLVAADARADIIEVAKMQYTRRNDLKNAAALFDNNTDEQLEYMELYGFEAARIALYEAIGDFRSAGELHLHSGDVEKAVSCFIRSSDHQTRRRAISELLSGLFSIAFGSEFTRDSTPLLEMLDNVKDDDLSVEEKGQVSIFRAMAQKDRTALKSLATEYMEKIAYRVLCQNQTLRIAGPPLDSLPLPSLLDELDFINSYYESLVGLVRKPTNLCLQLSVLHLFGIRRVEGPEFEHLTDHYMVKDASYLGQASARVPYSLPGQKYPPEKHLDCLLFPGNELDRLIRMSIQADVDSALSRLHAQLQNLRSLKLCINMAVQHSCNRLNCDRDHNAHKLPEYPNLVVRSHLIIIRTLGCLWWIPSNRDVRVDVQRVWLNKLCQVIQPLAHRLDLSNTRSITGGHESQRVVQSWIHEMVFHLVPSDRARYTFLSNATSLILLAELFADCQIPQYFSAAKVLFGPGRDLVRHNGEQSIVSDIIVSIARGIGGEWRLLQGVLCFKHIIEQQLAVDVQVLATYLERLVLEIIVMLRAAKQKGPEGMILPRSWILRAFQGPPRPACQLPQPHLLLGPVGALLTKLYNWTGHGCLLLNGSTLSAAFIPRSAIIARICRSLVLLGLNGAPEARGNIHRAIHGTITSSLRPNQRHPAVYAKYVAAHHWGGLEIALWDSGSVTDHDCLTMLHRRGTMPRVPRNVRVLEYGTLNEVLGLLYAPPPSRSSTHESPTADAAVSLVDQAVSLESIAVTSEHTQHVPTDEAVISAGDGDEMDINEEIDADSSDGVQGDAHIEDATLEREPDEHEVTAANLIQRWYRHMSHQRSSRRDPLLNKNYVACTLLADEIERSPLIHHRRYIYTLRGPFPHALAALDRFLNMTLRKRSETSKALLKVKHLELEKMRETMDKLISIIKDTRALRKRIEPGSFMSHSRNARDLQVAVEDVIALCNSAREKIKLPSDRKLDADLAIAYRGIVQPAWVPAAHTVERPSLNTADLGPEYD